MNLVDTHCHLTGLTEDRLSDILVGAHANGVNHAVCIGATNGDLSSREAVALAEKHPEIWATVGIHPHDAGQFTNLETLADLLSHPKVVAIGETGLDFFRDWAPVKNQYALFRDSIRIAKQHKKKLIIHCRAAEEETFEVLVQENAAEVGGVFHCFGGSAEFAARLREINFIVSFTGTVTFKSANALREVVAAIPLDQMMLETDTPYMAPEPFRGGPSEPKHVLQIAECVAKIKQLSLTDVCRTTTQTASKFFGVAFTPSGLGHS